MCQGAVGVLREICVKMCASSDHPTGKRGSVVGALDIAIGVVRADAEEVPVIVANQHWFDLAGGVSTVHFDYRVCGRAVRGTPCVPW
jgi:hypothetical protein